MSVMLSAVGVSKIFGQVRALNDVHLELGPGITGLLGPNGSGKSTLLKLFGGQLLPEEGQVRLLGEDPFRNPHVLAHLGLCPEQDKFYEEQTGLAFVRVLTRLHGFGRREAAQRALDAMARVGMTDYQHRRLSQMSRGMRQRTKIAQAIAHDPPVLLLDEPLTGADPMARADLIRLIHSLGAEGRCIVVSSHVLHEVEAMTHRVVFVRYGRVRAHGDVLRLRAMLTDRPYRIQLEVDAPRTLAAHLITRPHIGAVKIIDERTLELTTTALREASTDLPALAGDLGLVIHRFTSPDADLESLYRYLMSHSG